MLTFIIIEALLVAGGVGTFIVWYKQKKNNKFKNFEMWWMLSFIFNLMVGMYPIFNFTYIDSSETIIPKHVSIERKDYETIIHADTITMSFKDIFTYRVADTNNVRIVHHFNHANHNMNYFEIILDTAKKVEHITGSGK